MNKPVYEKPEEHPKSGSEVVGSLIDGLLEYVLEHPEPEIIKARARELLREVNWDDARYLGPEARRLSKRAYDLWIERIIGSVKQAVPQTTLIREFLDDLNTDINNEITDTICAFSLHALRTRSGIRIIAGDQRGLNDDRWNNFVRDELPLLQQSTLLRWVLVDHDEIDQWHLQYTPDYRDEFRGLLSKDDVRKCWLSAIPLVSTSADEAHRAVFILYRGRGTRDRPAPPVSGSLHYRVLQILGIAYRMLQSHLAGFAALTRQRRTELINQMAPGLLHHEIGVNQNLIVNNTDNLKAIADRLNHTFGGEDIDQMLDSIRTLETISLRIYDITDAFNNLERRHVEDHFPISKVVLEAKRFCFNRLGKAGIAMLVDESLDRVKLTSDEGLLLNLLVNIVLNAVNAIEEDPNAIHYTKSIDCRAGMVGAGQFHLDIYNTGPEIDEVVQERIFEQGYTTRQKGHGQGLYLCRLIAYYLGCTLTLLHRTQLPTERPYRVGFRLTGPSVIPTNSEA